MTQDARPTVHTDALDTLGSIIGPEEKRDAIHLAVYPIEAGELLQPGQHVQLDPDDGLAYRGAVGVNSVGIVDPFLRQPVQPDARFWLIVYPREITSLRHVWEHPAFPPSGETTDLLIGPNVRASEDWLRNFARDMDIEFEQLVRDCVSQGNDGDEYVVIHGEDASGSIPDLMWDHMEIYAGASFPRGRRPSYFSCSC
jgi:hypothetical protein